MRNLIDIKRILKAIVNALHALKLLIDDIPVPSEGGGGIDITSELAPVGTYNGQPLYAISYEDSTTFSSTGSTAQVATVSAAITNADYILLYYTMSAETPANWSGNSMVGFNSVRDDLFVSEWANLSSAGLRLAVKPKNDSNNIKPTVRAIFYLIKKSESI